MTEFTKDGSACALCADGWPRKWDGVHWAHDMPEPAGSWRCGDQWTSGNATTKEQGTMSTLDAPCGCNACSGTRRTLKKRPCERSGATARKGDWMQTYTGRQFWALDPRAGDLDIIDIAAALSKATRYGGHCLRFYSVAEHCVLMYREARRRDYPRMIARTALMHDASEAYLIDVPRPIKRSLTNYLEIEECLMRVIAARYRFPWPMPPEVKALDNAILADEMMQNMAPPPSPWHQIEGGPLGVTLECWNPDRAMVEFLRDAGEAGLLS